MEKKEKSEIEKLGERLQKKVRKKNRDGPPPGEELRRTSYSPRDISQMLGICEQGAYNLIKRENLPVITVDY